MKIKEADQEKNYRKLWLMEHTSSPFRYAVKVIRGKWHIQRVTDYKNIEAVKQILKDILQKENKKFFSSSEFAKIAPIINGIARISIPKEKIKQIFELNLSELPSNLFFEDVWNLAREFSYEGFWEPFLIFYLLTGKILAPHNKPSKPTHPPSVLQQNRMFYFKIIKEMQHEQLKDKGFKQKQGRGKGEKKDISISHREVDIHGKPLIHQYSDIADKIFGKLDLDDVRLSEKDRKRVLSIRTGVKLFRQRLVPLTPLYKRRLHKLFV